MDSMDDENGKDLTFLTYIKYWHVYTFVGVILANKTKVQSY